MVDDPGNSGDPNLAARWLRRLAGRRAMLVAAGAVLLFLVLLGRLAPGDGALAFVAIALVASLLPRAADLLAAPGGAALSEPGRDRALWAFADALPEPCILLDARSIVLHVNPAAAQEFPATRAGDPLGMSLRHPALLTVIEAARQLGVAQTTELYRSAPAESWHRVSVAPLGGDGTLAGMLMLTMRSRTEEKRVEAMRSDFIAYASHELRTPLTSLVGFIDTLLGPAARDAAARERFLGIMRTQAARMSKLIDDLLSLSRIELRQHMRPTGRVDLGAVLREVREGLQTQAREAAVAVEIEAPDEPATVTGDRDELYEVFENLIDNAIKYGGDGGRVEVRLRRAGRPGFDYSVEVVDHGAGIALEHVPRLTERFYRVDEDQSRKKKGTGLGLAIVKHIVQRHRGTLTIRSRPGEGMQVEVLLPG